MRLLNVDSLKFTQFREGETPRYVIASHRWVDGDEATLKDIQDGLSTNMSGYKKIMAFTKYVKEHVPSIEWLWIDTCCINQDSAAELSEAVNLMFDWYRNAELCIAYLADVEAADDMTRFEGSEWFKRGWTLQELLAPRLVIFVTNAWQVIGNKGASSYGGSGILIGPRLEKDIARITGIPEKALHDYEASRGWSVNERLKWMEDRSTTREEDMSYALYGIFGVTPGANYGEKRAGAKQRLLAAIHNQEDLAAHQAERFRRIVNWISAPDPWTNHRSARERHEPQTGTWLLSSPHYQHWKSAFRGHLWLYGKAGCGKTVLCSMVIEDVKSRCENTRNAGYAFFYLSFSDNQKQRYDDLLRSLVAQLGWKGPALSMLQQAYDIPNRNLPGPEELEKILLACLESYDELFLLVDALDECPEDGDVRHNMLQCLARLSLSAPQLRIFATSRELPDIRDSMATLGAEPISINIHSVDADIRRHVATLLSHDHRLSRLDSTMKALIEETISAKADGMFRWAYCQLQELKKLKSTRTKFVKEALYSLPATLDETYERMLTRIEEPLRPEAITLLRWLVYAKSPPSLGELVDAAVIELAAGGSVDMDDRGGVDDVLMILSGLVTIEGDDNALDRTEDAGRHDSESDANEIERASPHQQIRSDTNVKLAHFSVKEYLESKRMLGSTAKDFHFDSAREHRVLSQSCLIYLTHYSNSETKLSTAQDLKTFPLLRYAAQSWFYHSALQQAAGVTREADLLCSRNTLHDWLLVCQPDLVSSQPFGTLENIGSSLYYASVVGLEQVVGELLKAGADVHAQGGRFNNALQAASYHGHEKVVQMLLDAGADVNAQGGNEGNALYAALRDERVVRMLLDAGADVNACGGVFGNALQEASFNGREKVVQMLLDAGADVNAQGGSFTNALYAASYKGNEVEVQMLLDARADVNAQGGIYGNALQTALLRRHDKVVQTLMAAGANVHAQGGEYGNALQAAAFQGNMQVVQMLLATGAEVNAQGGHFGNALQAASYQGHERVVQMLLDAGADVNAQGGRFINALYAAVGDEKVVRMLLDAGADVNAFGGVFGNALQSASDKGYEEVVQMLLDAGANVDAQGGFYGNALQAALTNSHEKVAQILVDAGADNPTEWSGSDSL